MVRPNVSGNDIFSVLVRVMYDIDKEALNCFPSIHSLMGTAMVIGVVKTKNFSKGFKFLSCIIGVGCVLSTVFIKQHYFIDMIVGVMLMILTYVMVLYVDKKLLNKQNKM